MANVLIIGGGFSGLVASERLAASLSPADQITVVAPNRRFTFYPSLVHLALGECEPDDIQFDLQAKFDELDVRFVQGEMLRINREHQTVSVAGDDFNGDIGYDHLIIAPGRRLATEKVPGFFEYSHHLLGVKAAVRFRDAVDAFTEGTIIVGSCPGARLPVAVCETAFALSNKFENDIRSGRIKVKVVFPESLAAEFGGARLHKELEAAFTRHGIDVHYEIAIREVTSENIISHDKHRIDYDLLMLLPPFKGQAILSKLGITDDEDFVHVNGLMQIQGLKNAYAAGDIVAFSGPKFAHMAVRQAEVAAANIASEIRGEAPAKEYYHEIATIIDAGGADSIYLHYGIWDSEQYRLKKGRMWKWAKDMHSSLWQKRHG